MFLNYMRRYHIHRFAFSNQFIRRRYIVPRQFQCISTKTKHDKMGEKDAAAGVHITKVGAVVNVGLAGSKGAIGYLTGSTALLADAAHSLSDLFSDALTVFAVRLSRTPADEDHPYGHGKFETMGALSIGALLTVAGVNIVTHSYDQLLIVFGSDQTLRPIIAASVASSAIIMKEVLYRKTISVARHIVSNAWHHRSDALSSLVALGGICGSFMGLPLVDPMAGIIIGGLIVNTGARIGWNNIRELVDESDPETLKRITKLTKSVFGVKNVSRVRSRRMGYYELDDLKLQLENSRSS
eukprot:GSMAST32.ASY1.ANO1.394.1 assembled CDS